MTNNRKVKVLAKSPHQIDLSARLSGTFGKAEVEEAACHFIHFLQETFNERGHWPSFTWVDLWKFYFTRGLDTNRMLFGLIGYWWDDGGVGAVREAPVQTIVHCGDFLEVSGDFIERVSQHIVKGK